MADTISDFEAQADAFFSEYPLGDPQFDAEKGKMKEFLLSIVAAMKSFRIQLAEQTELIDILQTSHAELASTVHQHSIRIRKLEAEQYDVRLARDLVALFKKNAAHWPGLGGHVSKAAECATRVLDWGDLYAMPLPDGLPSWITHQALQDMAELHLTGNKAAHVLELRRSIPLATGLAAIDDGTSFETLPSQQSWLRPLLTSLQALGKNVVAPYHFMPY